MADNPYLAHLPEGSTLKKQKIDIGSKSNGASTPTGGALDGMIPRKVNGAQTIKAMVSESHEVVVYMNVSLVGY